MVCLSSTKSGQILMQARLLHDDINARQDRLVTELPRLQRICAALAASPQEVDELVQLTCEEALDRRLPMTSHDAWLIGSLVRAWRGWNESPAVHGADEPAMRCALSALSPRERLLTALVVVDGTPSRRIARLMGLGREEMRGVMRRASTRLAAAGGQRWARELRAIYAVELHRPIRPRAIAAARGATVTARRRPPLIARRAAALTSWLAVILALLAVSIAAGVSDSGGTVTIAQQAST